MDIRAKCYPPTKLTGVLDAGRDAGLPETWLLQGTGLTPAAVRDVQTLTSIEDFLTVVRNLVRHCPAPDLGLQIGRRLPISHYGLYGYAILCAGSLRQACDIAVRYALLRGPVFGTAFEERGDTMTWVFTSKAGMTQADLGLRMYRTLLEAQFLVCITTMADVMRSGCTPICARFAMPAPAHAEALAEAFGCPILFDQPVNELEYPSRWLNQPPRLASPLMSESVCHTLSSQLEALKRSAGIALRVHEELTRTPGTFPTMEALASRLYMTSRHLRRKLEAEGTSYQLLLANVREAMAIDFLTSSRLTTEDIAPILGFSSATSFRHAFKRWTGKTPTEFRRTPASQRVAPAYQRRVSNSVRAEV